MHKEQNEIVGTNLECLGLVDFWSTEAKNAAKPPKSRLKKQRKKVQSCQDQHESRCNMDAGRGRFT